MRSCRGKCAEQPTHASISTVKFPCTAVIASNLTVAQGPVIRKLLRAHVTLDSRISPWLLLYLITRELLVIMSTAHDALFKTLADPTRRALFEQLCREGAKTVGPLPAQARGWQPAGSNQPG